MSYPNSHTDDSVAGLCRFSFVDDGNGMLQATCQACGRQVKVRSRKAKAACKASPRYVEAHAELLGEVTASEPAKPFVGGAGHELRKMLAKIGITASPTCGCRRMAAKMDAWGPDECLKPARMDEVLEVMRAEAKARGLPFLDSVGRALIRRAVRKAQKRPAPPPPA